MPKKLVELPKVLPGHEAERRAREILSRIQHELMPRHASDVVGINLESGEYVLGETYDEAHDAFHERWPNLVGFMIRVNGGPVFKFHGK
jgi:hypothetical protein